MTELKAEGAETVPRVARFSQAAAAMNNLGATDDEQKKRPRSSYKASRVPTIINWTGTFLAGLGETLVFAVSDTGFGRYVFAKAGSGDAHDARQEAGGGHQPRDSATNFQLSLSVSLINLGLGLDRWGWPLLAGVPNAAMWGMLIALLNFVPYFGPFAGICLLAIVGLLTFDTLWKATSSTRLVFAVSSFGIQLHYAGLAGSPLHAQPGRHFRLA
jgi:hypothetical protein